MPYKTPGVYIVEKNAYPSSAIAVETAVPVFIGYTDIADNNGKSLINVPLRVTSFAEFILYFGGGVKQKYKIEEYSVAIVPAIPAQDVIPLIPAGPEKPISAFVPSDEIFNLNKTSKTVKISGDNTFYLYNSIKLFYANGGSVCYVHSIGNYSSVIQTKDFIDAINLLENENEPTLVLMPDAINLALECYRNIYTFVLQHCNKMQNRFAIFDLLKLPLDVSTSIVDDFRNAIGINFLNYGAAYFPWLKTTVVDANEIDFENIDLTSITDLTALLPEDKAKEIIGKVVSNHGDILLLEPNDKTSGNLSANDITKIKKNFHQSLKAASPSYVTILEEIRSRINILPPSGAMAGIYTMVDNSRGVWKAPANVSLNMVSAPLENITAEAQQNLNVDVIAGKSINVIRPFPGNGTLVWGARTLDGNSQDWRYINVRRTIIMIEQSLKLAARDYVFEPNDANTWITIKSMFTNFLTNLWKQGALAGAVPEEAFSVQIGLGSTMTANDILDGMMKISVKLAIVRPAEFIEITFQQQQQES